jgi:NADH-quinone oxidoreductase subunit E
MPEKDTKSHFVGLRMTEKENDVLAKARDKANLSKTDVLLRGLELAAEYYSLELDQKPLSQELKALEEEAKKHSEGLMRVRNKEKAIRNMISELREVDEIIDRHGCDANSLIQVLLEVQQKNHWLPRHALLWISERLQVPMARILQIANFYDAFSLEPQGEHNVQICTGSTCHVLGAQQLLQRAAQVFGLQAGQTSADGRFTLSTVHCFGCCALAPVAKVDNEYYSDPDVEQLEKIIAGAGAAMEK